MAALLAPVPAPARCDSANTSPRPDLTRLRDDLHRVVAAGRQASDPWRTGIVRLDWALGGGIPRGRITEISGPMAIGKTALLRQLVTQVLQSGAWVAWIDAQRTLAPAPWAALGARFVVIRPPDATRSAWTADQLLRSGVFAVVVIDGAPPVSRAHGIRLAQLARERDAACVVLTHHDSGREERPSRLAGTVRLRIAAIPVSTPSLPPSLRVSSRVPPPRRPPRAAPDSSAHEVPLTAAITGVDASRRFVVTVEKGGNSQGRSPSIEVNSAVVVARRVCADSEIPDRRGVARSARRPWTARGNSSDTEHGQPPQEHPVTWGGLGVAGHDLYGTDVPGHPARLAAGLDDAPSDRLGGRLADERHTRELDRLTRDWTTYRGRRRAAESGYGRRSRRDAARERTGALLASHSGQSRGSNGSPRLGRDTTSEGTPADTTRSRTGPPAALG